MKPRKTTKRPALKALACRNEPRPVGAQLPSPSPAPVAAVPRTAVFQQHGYASGEAMLDALCAEVEKISGTKSALAAERVATQLANCFRFPTSAEAGEDPTLRALVTLQELAPANYIEAQLVVQMTATHEAALNFLHRAFREGQTIELIDLNVARASKLMNLHLRQVEALQLLRLKGKGSKQRVIVKHVHVHAGGQAVVGAIGAPAGQGEGGE